MKPAVREVKACSSLLRKDAVPALAMALATRFVKSGVAGVVPFTLQTPSTKPSRSTTATTLLGEIRLARVTAWASTFDTSVARFVMICEKAGAADSRVKPSRRRCRSRFTDEIFGQPRGLTSLKSPPQLAHAHRPGRAGDSAQHRQRGAALRG